MVRPWRRPTRGDRPRLVPTLATGAAAAALVIAAGIPLLDRYERPWVAHASVLVLPDAGLEPTLAAGYYEQLNGGRVVATYAELVRATGVIGPGPSPGPFDADVEVSVVTDTALLRISATAPEARAAEYAADTAATGAVRYVRSLGDPFQLVPATRAAGTAERSGTPPRTLLVVLLVVALATGLAVQQLHLLVCRSRSRPEPVEEPAAVDRPASTLPPPAPAPAPAEASAAGPAPPASGGAVVLWRTGRDSDREHDPEHQHQHQRQPQEPLHVAESSG